MKVPQNVSESTRRLNPHLYPPVGGLQSPKPQSDSGNGSAPANERKEKGKSRVGKGRSVLRITLIRLCHREITDSDNLAPGFKWTRDAIAASFGCDDRDDLIKWQYGQVETRGKEGTIVRIELLQD
jgi:hypothetical protein